MGWFARLLLSQWKKLLVLFAALGGTLLYFIKQWQLEVARQRAESIDAELRQTRDSYAAQDIIDTAADEADDIVNKAYADVDKNGEELASALHDVFDDKL